MMSSCVNGIFEPLFALQYSGHYDYIDAVQHLFDLHELHLGVRLNLI